MTTYPAEEFEYPSIQKVSFPGKKMKINLRDGRELFIPLAHYPRLAHATRRQLLHYEISASGYGVHWPDLDEDLSIRGFLSYKPGPVWPEVVRDAPRKRRRISR